ncbi:hypothetical protein [Actinopolymorpha rutila]|uniref:Nucleotidyltransferase domain-containing protein n=1 Tax=Actinopolymorpha rutila TaxID=446787 RepID=A0A852ZPH2_9ACTN|nr:hypothetical protein [Actinopolymorpha rutila]NYH91369.1 hypothetical protein [Actinopolymorpha rutila]
MGVREERAARADARLAQARQVLEELSLLDRWKAVGDPVVVGSVALGLVVRPDVDLEVYADSPSIRDGFGVVAALAELPRVRAMRYKDERDRPPQGLYWKLEYELTPEETWHVDMWLFPRDLADRSSGQLADALTEALTENRRDAVLAIKEEAVSQGARAHGYWVYRAVIDVGVVSYTEYLDWLGDRDVWERTNWRPTPAGGGSR